MQRSSLLDTELLSETECREVLRLTRVGRLLSIGGRFPDVIAVTFALVFDDVIFSYPADPRLPDIALLPVTFEAHDFPSGSDEDRSVYLRGVLQRLDEPLDVRGLEIIAPWVCNASSTPLEFFAVSTRFMTGIRSSTVDQAVSHLRLV